MICNLPGSKVRFGSMGKPTFFYDMLIADAEGNELPVHETGQIAVRMHPERFRGVFKSYIGDEEKQKQYSNMDFIIQAIKLIKMKMVTIGLLAGMMM
jgi:acetyl-CoA synthetase